MTERIIFAGFGGQGVILAGKLMCIAAMREGKQVSHIPSYGAEMRGGTANCGVVISDEPVASPLVRKPSICVVLNKPSLLKFEERLQEGGLLIYNESLIDIKPGRKDIQAVAVKANDIAQEEGSVRAANMVILGLLARMKPQMASLEAVIAAMKDGVSARNKELIAVNEAALKRGFALA
jgi:2-oxoglutarate ferredoxin oxidoreductase subunit gamma